MSKKTEEIKDKIKESEENKPLTAKQEKFAMLVVEYGNAAKAYREAYDVTTTNTSTMTRKASEISKKPNVSKYIDDLRKYHRKRHDVTIDSLTAELEEARLMARDQTDPKAMVSASLGKAKIHGLDKQVIEHSGDLSNLQPVVNLTFGDK